MNNDYSTYDLFFRFENNTLSSEELQLFQERLKNDSAFKEEYQNYQLSGEIIINHKLYDVKRQLDKFDYNNIESNSSGKNYWKYFLIATISVLVVAAGYYYFNQQSTKETTPVKEENKSIENTATPQSYHSGSAPVKKSGGNVNTQTPAPIPSSGAPSITPASSESTISPTTTTVNNSNSSASTSVNTNTADKEFRTDAPAGDNTKNNPCEAVSIKADKIIAKPSCNNAISGQISLSEINGGTAPYQCTVNNKKYAKGEYVIPYLSAGEYLIQISDAKNCISKTYTVEVEAKNCNSNYSIQPDAGIFWTYTYAQNGATLVIQDKLGSLVLNKKIEGTEYTWEGADQYGNLMAPGVYLFKITYPNGEKESGSITIIQ